MAHDHGHAPGPATYGRAFAIGIGLNLGFVLIETVLGIVAGSLALVADAGHNLSDVFGLVLAWGASLLVGRRPTLRRSYGLRRASIGPPIIVIVRGVSSPRLAINEMAASTGTVGWQTDSTCRFFAPIWRMNS